MSEWQPIETAPRDGTSVLLRMSDGIAHQGAFQGPSDGAIYARRTASAYNWISETVGASLYEGDIAYWAPLPKVFA